MTKPTPQQICLDYARREQPFNFLTASLREHPGATSMHRQIGWELSRAGAAGECPDLREAVLALLAECDELANAAPRSADAEAKPAT